MTVQLIARGPTKEIKILNANLEMLTDEAIGQVVKDMVKKVMEMENNEKNNALDE